MTNFELRFHVETFQSQVSPSINTIFGITNTNVRINVAGAIPYDVAGVNEALKNGGIARLGLLL